MRYTIPLLVLTLAGCAQNPPIPQSVTITVMSMNAQNLFDNVDDAGKDDKAYLPLTDKQSAEHIAACEKIEVESWRNECLYLDWSDAAIERKLAALAMSIRQVADGRGPDIIAFQEIENASVLNRLSREFLADMDYRPAVLIEGSDLRGIDVAFLSRYPLATDAVLHPLEIPDFADRAGDTRGVLQADFRLPDSSFLTGFAVHFPAPFHPTPMRIAAYRHLNALRAALPDDRHAFAAGDFNTTSSEDARERLLDNHARPHWTLAHDVGCATCKGTYYYRPDQTWSFLDMILFTAGRGADTTAQIRGDSVEIANQYAQQRTSEGLPRRHRSEDGTGVSDHWPIVATIELTQKQ